jgi:hypothetical protein
MLLINAEGYLQSFGGRNGFPDFTWKPFINDPSAILQLIPTLFDRPLEFGAGFRAFNRCTGDSGLGNS